MSARVSNIPSGVAFADALASGLIERFGADGIPDIMLLVPNRRAARALQDAFLRQSGGTPMLLPEMRPLGEIDEDEIFFADTGLGDTGLADTDLGDALDLPPAIPEMRRRAMLAELVLRFAEKTGRKETPGSALRLAAELARLMDQVETEKLGFDGLKDLVEAEYAHHWQDTLKFLEIVSAAWPAVLAKQGLMNPAARRTQLTDSMAENWRANPPSRPIIAAGSTGSIPATRALLKVVANLPEGQVVLPGLDQASSDEDWQAVGETHPQHMMKALLKDMGVTRADVSDWGAPAKPERAARTELLRHAMAPASASADWRTLDRAEFEGARRDIRLIECPGPREEATVIALAMREALETPETSAALITPDRALARRVRTELKRWGIDVDDSGGTPLGHTPPGAFLRAVLEAATEAFHPVPFLSLVKHPFSACGMERGEFLDGVRQLEVQALRGPRPGAGLKGLKAAAKHPRVSAEACASLTAATRCLQDFETMFAKKSVSFASLLQAHVEAAEALAARCGGGSTDTGEARLWRGDNGEPLADFIDELRTAAEDLGDIAPRDYLAAWDALIGGQNVRPRWGGHPRLHIWGTIEARMQPADLVILGGLNENTWPPAAASDPWMSREMHSAFGLPSAERRIGQSAHDFVQALGADDVLLTRSKKVDGTPTVPSRWLLRLEALIGPLPGGRQPWLGWCDKLAEGDGSGAAPISPPRPTPPLSARPTKLPVSAVQEWMRDPYALYARRILKLRALDALDQPPGAADRGTIIHKAFETFFERAEMSGILPDNALELLLEDGKRAFADVMARPAVWAFWWPRFEEIAKAFIAEQKWREGRFDILGSEVEGEVKINGTATSFTLTAKADRIDRDTELGELVIIDYKTGAIPQRKQIHAGYAPQLPLEGVIAEAGGFEGIDAGPVSELSFWKMQGGKQPLTKEWPRDEDVGESITRAREGLRRLIDTFANEDSAYLSHPRPSIAGGGDYDHLARVDEWTGQIKGQIKGEIKGKIEGDDGGSTS